MSRAPADPREALRKAVAGGRDSLAALSRMLGHADGYLHRFIHNGVPIALCAEDHRYLADFFGLTERELGIRDCGATDTDRADRARAARRGGAGEE
jgi:hypothetical protein